MTCMQLLFEQRLQCIRNKIQAACERSDRNFCDVHIVAVTKYADLESTRAVIAQGCMHMGESRWPDARVKLEKIDANPIWHFIGHLQTNKVKHVAAKFQYLHSLDRLSLAIQLEKQLRLLHTHMVAFIQVNLSGHHTKYGLFPDEVPYFLRQLQSFKHLHVRGLMTMAPQDASIACTRSVFRQLRELKQHLNTLSLTVMPLTHLSMGMSNDFEIAVEEGATWVRLGSAIFKSKEDKDGCLK